MSAVHQQLHALYTEHHGWLTRWLRGKLGNSFDAADLAQDTFVKVLRGMPPEPIREPRAYLVTVAGGLLHSHWRRRALEQAWLEALALQPPACAPSPEERRLVLEALEEIDRLLDGLPPRVREAFLLSQLEGLGYAQIAERQGVTVHVVQKAMTRAMLHCYRVTYA